MGIWRFPEIWVPLSHLFEIGIFHERNHPAIGVPTFLESPIYIYNSHQLCHDLTKDDGFRFQGQCRDGVTIYEKNITNCEDL